MSSAGSPRLQQALVARPQHLADLLFLLGAGGRVVEQLRAAGARVVAFPREAPLADLVVQAVACLP